MLKPTALPDTEPAKVIASGSHHTMFIDKSGSLFACGSALHGKLGLKTSNTHVHKFSHVRLPRPVKQVAVGDYHTMCLTDDGKVLAWGGSLHKKTANNAPGSEPKVV